MKNKYLIKYSYITVVIFFLFGYQLIAQNCDTSLEAHNNRDKRMVMPSDGTVFKVNLKNSTRTSQTYSMTTRVYQIPCEKISGKAEPSVSKTPPLKVRLIRNDKSVDQLTLQANSTTQILVEVEMGPTAILNNWHCLEVVAESQKCSDEIILPLQVLVSDGTAE